MRLFIALFFILLTCKSSLGQTRQLGRVYIQNSGKKPLPLVQIKADGAPITASRNNGLFNLTFRRKTKGDQIIFENIEKPGFEVVNRFELNKARCIPSDTLIIAMCKNGELKKAQERYYEIFKGEIDKSYYAEEKKLNKGDPNYPASIRRLQEDRNARLLNAQNYATVTSQLNLDFIDSMHKSFVRFLEMGQIDSAIKELQKLDIRARADTILRLNQSIKKTERELIDLAINQAYLFSIKGIIDSSKSYFELAIHTDSLNVSSYLLYSEFLQEHKRFKEALFWATKPETYRNSRSERIELLIRKVEVLKDLEEEEIALTNIDFAINEIINAPNVDERNDLNSRFLAPCLSSRASLLVKMGNLVDILPIYDSVVEIYLSSQSKDIYTRMVGLGSALGNKGRIYDRLNDYENAVTYYSLCIAVFKNVRGTYDPMSDIARAYSSLGSLYQRVGQLSKAKASHIAADYLWQNLSLRYGEKFVDEQAISLSNFGYLYIEIDSFNLARTCLSKSMDIRKKLNQYNPNLYDDELSIVYRNLAIIYAHENDANKTTEYFSKSIEIQTHLLKNDSIRFKKELAKTFLEIGRISVHKRQAINADTLFQIAIGLTLSNSHYSNSFLAVVYNELALSALIQKKYDESFKYAREAEEVWKKWPEADILFAGNEILKNLKTFLMLFADQYKFTKNINAFTLFHEYKKKFEEKFHSMALNERIIKIYKETEPLYLLMSD